MPHYSAIRIAAWTKCEPDWRFLREPGRGLPVRRRSRQSCCPPGCWRNNRPDLRQTKLGSADSCRRAAYAPLRSEEHTSELQSPCNLVCRLLLEKKNKIAIY